MDFNFNFDVASGSNAPLDNSSAQLQADPNYPANLGDPDLLSNPFAGFDKTFNQTVASSKSTPIKESSVIPYEQSAKYEDTPAYGAFTSPYGDSARIAAENWTMWDAIGTGLSGLTDNAINAGKEYAYGWVRAGRALVNFDSSYLKPSELETQMLGIEQEMTSRENPLYFDPGSEDDIFSRGFVAEFLQNSGFTFGTMAGFLTETALLGGIGTMGAKLPKLFKAGAMAKSVNLAEKATMSANALGKSQTLAESMKNIYGSGVFTGKTIFDNTLNVASKLPVIGAVADAAKIMKAGRALEGAGAIALSGAEIAKIGAGGLKRAFSEWNFAASESAIEAGGTYGEVYDALYEKQVDENNGLPPTPEQMEKIRSTAMDASSAGYNTNFAVLAVMNKIAFGNLFRNFGTDSKFLGLLRSEADRVLAVSGIDKGGKQLTQLLPKGYWGALGHRSAITNTFGKETFYREVGRDMIRGLGRIELTEGLQENIQEGTNEFLKSYYTDLYDDNVANWGASFNEAFQSQTTKRGFKTFLQGALTGFAIRPVTGAAQAARNAYLDKKAKDANPDHVDALELTLQRLNVAFADPYKVLNENHRTIKEQVLLNEGMTKGAAKGDKYQYLNNKDSSIIKHALDAKRTGTFEAYKEMLLGYGQSVDEAEFKEATGIDLKAEGISSPAEYTSNLVKKLDRYSELYDKYNKMFGDYLSYEALTKDSYSKQRFSFAQAAIRDAIHVAAFNEAKAESALTRAAELTQSVVDVRAIGQSAAANFNTVTDHSLAAQQITIINNEIKTLKESGPLTPETKQLIKLKEKEKKALEQWNDLAYVEEVLAKEGAEETSYIPLNRRKMTAQKRKEMAKVLTEYYEAKNLQSNIKIPILTKDVESVLDSINDYQKLDRDAKDYLDAVNLLSDPTNMLRSAQAFEDARVAAYARLAHDTYMSLARESEIFANYVKDNPEQMDNLLKLAKSPFGSYDTIKTVMEAIAKINELSEKPQETSTTEAAPVGPKPGDPADLSKMSPEEVSKWIVAHYAYNEDGDDIVNIERFYTDASGTKHVTHTIKPEDVLAHYKARNKKKVTVDDLQDDDYNQYLRYHEQALFNLKNPDAAAGTQEAAERQEAKIKEVKKLANLVGSEVFYMGRPGTLAIEKGNYIVRYDDNTTTVLGPETKRTESKFQHNYDSKNNVYILSEVVAPEEVKEPTIDNYPFLQVNEGKLSPKVAKVIGIDLEASVTRVEDESYKVLYNRDETGETINISDNVFIINRDADNQIVSMVSDQDKFTVTFTKERAEKDPNSLDAKYIALAQIKYAENILDINDPETETKIDAALGKIEELQGTEDAVVISGTDKRSRVRKRKVKEDVVDDTEKADRIMRDTPQDLIEAVDIMLHAGQRKRNSLGEEVRLKVRDWALGRIIELDKLDPENAAVISYKTKLNDSIITPAAKRDGRPNTAKQQKKATRKEDKAVEPTAEFTPNPSGPSDPGSYELGSAEAAVDFIENAFDKKEKELAVKIEELLPESPALFNQKEIEDATNIVNFNPNTYNASLKKKKDISDDPYDNPPFSCP